MRHHNGVAALLAAGLCGGCTTSVPSVATVPLAPRIADIEYQIEGRPMRLSSAGAGAASPEGTIRWFGNELRKDLDGDGREDVAFIATRNPGGSGTFFYLVAALDTEQGPRGSDGVLLGDRIAPQATTSGPGRSVVVAYAERGRGEPMSAAPSVGRTRRLLLDGPTLRFGEVAQDFEGEADPARMTLSMKPWTWIEARYNDGAVVSPRQPGGFVLTLESDGRFSATTDCNRLTGGYTAADGTLAFGDVSQTRMYCEGSQEGVFIGLLRESHRYRFTSRGELVMELRFDSGIVVFR
jgi:heat shock protein HslJ